MRCARDTGVVVPPALLTSKLELVVGQIDVFGDKSPQVLLYAGLILRGGRDDPCLGDQAVLVQVVPMIEDTSRSFANTIPPGCAGGGLNCPRVTPLWLFCPELWTNSLAGLGPYPHDDAFERV